MAMPTSHVQILLTLAKAPTHGYAIMQDAATAGERLGPASLYAALARLEATGLVEEQPAPQPDADTRRRYYRITAAGRQALGAEITRLRSVVARADSLAPRLNLGTA